jgi:hypothetical protein
MNPGIASPEHEFVGVKIVSVTNAQQVPPVQLISGVEQDILSLRIEVSAHDNSNNGSDFVGVTDVGIGFDVQNTQFYVPNVELSLFSEPMMNAEPDFVSNANGDITAYRDEDGWHGDTIAGGDTGDTEFTVWWAGLDFLLIDEGSSTIVNVFGVPHVVDTQQSARVQLHLDPFHDPDADFGPSSIGGSSVLQWVEAEEIPDPGSIPHAWSDEAFDPVYGIERLFEPVL